MNAPAPLAQGVEDTPIDIALGLPGPLPEGERVLWHGQPTMRGLARSLFRWPWLVGYFTVVAALPVLATAQQGAHWVQVALSPLLLAPFALAVAGFVAFGSWTTARTSTYVITDRRVILNIGAAFTRTINIPLKLIAHVGEREKGASRDIALTIKQPNNIAFLALWPHALATEFSQPVPLLRGLPADTEAPAILVDALMREAPGYRFARESRQPSAEPSHV